MWYCCCYFASPLATFNQRPVSGFYFLALSFFFNQLNGHNFKFKKALCFIFLSILFLRINMNFIIKNCLINIHSSSSNNFYYFEVVFSRFHICYLNDPLYWGDLRFLFIRFRFISAVFGVFLEKKPLRFVCPSVCPYNKCCWDSLEWSPLLMTSERIIITQNYVQDCKRLWFFHGSRGARGPKTNGAPSHISKSITGDRRRVVRVR